MNGDAIAQPADQGDVDVERKRFAGSGVNQPGARRQRPPHRREDERDDPVDLGERDEHADRDREARSDDALAELLEQIEQRQPRPTADGNPRLPGCTNFPSAGAIQRF